MYEIMIHCTDDDYEGNLCTDDHEGGNFMQWSSWGVVVYNDDDEEGKFFM